MAIDFSSLKDALSGQNLVGFARWTEAHGNASNSKLTTSKRGGKAISSETGLAKASTSKRGDKGPR